MLDDLGLKCVYNFSFGQEMAIFVRTLCVFQEKNVWTLLFPDCYIEHYISPVLTLS